jgi:hypothetical protein
MENEKIEKYLLEISTYTKWIFVMVLIVFIGKVLSFIGDLVLSAL